jgi:hypothetical protein
MNAVRCRYPFECGRAICMRIDAPPRVCLADAFLSWWRAVVVRCCRLPLAELTKNPVDGFSVGLKDDDNIYVWQCMMEGPAGTD